jgi:hypothetical protein
MGVVETSFLVLLAVLLVGMPGIAVAVARPRVPDVDEWVGAGVITPDQAVELRRRREGALHDAHRERAARVLGVLGGATFGVGVILFFAANWGDIPRLVRVGILLGGLVALYAAGFWLLERSRAWFLGHALVFVGAILFGAPVCVDSGRIEYGIETFYVEEGKAIEYERAIARGNLYADVALDDDGGAQLDDLVVRSG